MVDAVRLLLDDHDRLRVLLAVLEQPGRDSERGVSAALLDTELRVHVALEGEIFFPAIAQAAAPGGPAPIGAAAAALERGHADAVALARRLRTQVAAGRAHQATLARLRRLLLDHCRAEEQELFPAARRVGGEALERIGWRLARRREELVALLWPADL